MASSAPTRSQEQTNQVRCSKALGHDNRLAKLVSFVPTLLYHQHIGCYRCSCLSGSLAQAYEEFQRPQLLSFRMLANEVNCNADTVPMRAHTRTHTHERMHTNTHTHTHSHTRRKHIQTNIQKTHTSIHTRTQTSTHTHTHTRTSKRKHTRTHNEHTHNIQTHARALIP